MKKTGRVILLDEATARPPYPLRLDTRPIPEPGPDQIRVRIRAAGVAYADVTMRHGLYPGVPARPFAPGYDIAGDVDAVGAAVTDFAVGDRVAALTFIGGYADYIVIATDYVAPIPDSVDYPTATSLVLNYVTAQQMLHRVARVRAGQTLLVHGAAGGVGTALLDLARHLDVTVFGTASAGKHDQVRRLGGDPIDYRNHDFVAVMSERSDGADVVFDHLGGAHLRRSRQVLKRGGRVVCYGTASAVGGGRWWTVLATFANILAISLRPGYRASFYGILIAPFDKKRYIGEDLKAVLDMAARGEIAPVIGAKVPLEEAERAHRLMEDRAVVGKIVLTTAADDSNHAES
ncbi:MAG: medium chain dehydrogenase/reductase family protein [Myxococcota bacterium]